MKTSNATPSANYKFRNVHEAVQYIKSNVELVSVMADAGVAIPDSGSRTVKVRCFEHEDDTPSLVISKDKQLFNCFGAGCTVGGDVVAFVQQFLRFTFGDALSYLINTYNIDVASLVIEATAEEKARDRYININHAAATYLSRVYWQTEGSRRLLTSKGISDQTAREMLIGYSKNAAALCSHLRTAGYTQADIDILQFTRDDIWTNRIIYPLFDIQGRIVSFYGRAVGKAASKYIGLSRTYKDKAHPVIDIAVPYGLHVARRHVSSDLGRLIMVEGHNDVLGLHSNGIKNVAAMMTSAPNEKQYTLLRDIQIKNVIICPDSDEAGFRTIASINENRSVHQQVKIMTIPDGSDPDEFVRDQGPTAFRKLLDSAVYPIEVIIRDVAERYSNSTTTNKLDMAQDAMKHMAFLTGFEREFAMDELSTVTGVDRMIIEESIAAMDEGPMTDVDLERKIIGECIGDKVRAIHAMSVLSDEDFTAAKHSTMWAVLREMISADIDPFSREMFVTYAMDKGFMTDKDISLVPVIQLGSMHSLDYAMAKLADLTLRRKLAKSATRLLVEAKAKKSDVREVLNSHMISIASSTSHKREVTTAQQHITGVMDTIHQRMSSPGIPGINIGPHWSKFMSTVMGFQKGHMLIIAGVSKTGKTTAAQNWNIQQLLHVGAPTLWVNLEMNQDDLVMRNLSILSGVDNSRMKIGNISKEEKNAIDRAAATYHGFKLHVANLAGANTFDVVNCVRRYVYTHGVRLVFIDYVQLIRTDRARQKAALWEEQNDVVATLRDAISKLGVTGVVISQLNRGAMAEQSASGQYVSGTIKLIQDSDCFMGIRKKTEAELEITPHSNSSLMIEFNRHGPQGLEIDLQFKYGCMQIREI